MRNAMDNSIFQVNNRNMRVNDDLVDLYDVNEIRGDQCDNADDEDGEDNGSFSSIYDKEEILDFDDAYDIDEFSDVGSDNTDLDDAFQFLDENEYNCRKCTTIFGNEDPSTILHQLEGIQDSKSIQTIHFVGGFDGCNQEVRDTLLQLFSSKDRQWKEIKFFRGGYKENRQWMKIQDKYLFELKRVASSMGYETRQTGWYCKALSFYPKSYKGTRHRIQLEETDASANYYTSKLLRNHNSHLSLPLDDLAKGFEEDKFDNVIEALHSNTSLKHLFLIRDYDNRYRKRTNREMQAVFNCLTGHHSILESMAIQNFSVDDFRAMEDFCLCHGKLKKFSLVVNSIGPNIDIDEAFRILAKCPNLKEIEVKGRANKTRLSLEPLLYSKSLEVLDLKESIPFRSEDVVAFAKTLLMLHEQGNRQGRLRKLSINLCDIGGTRFDGVQAIASVLAHPNSTLESLVLVSRDDLDTWDCKEIECLCKSLKVNKTLLAWWIDDLGQDCIEPIVAMLQQNTRLESLGIKMYPYFEDDHVVKIMQGIRFDSSSWPQTLKSLDIGDVKLSSIGTRAMASALEKNMALHTLTYYNEESESYAHCCRFYSDVTDDSGSFKSFKSPEYMIELYLKLNKAGRKNLIQGYQINVNDDDSTSSYASPNAEKWVSVLTSLRDDLDAIFHIFIMNPTFVDYLVGDTSVSKQR